MSRAVVFARSLACFRCAHEVKTIENTQTRLQLLVYLAECCLCCLHMVYRRRSHSQSDSLHRPRRVWGGCLELKLAGGARYARDGNQSRSQPSVQHTRRQPTTTTTTKKLYALIQYIDVGQKCATCLSATATATIVTAADAAAVAYPLQPAVPFYRSPPHTACETAACANPNYNVRQLVEVQRDNEPHLQRT